MVYKSNSSENIYRISLLLLFFYKFVGLATFSINKRGNSKKCLEDVLIADSKLAVSCNLLFSCLIIASNYITVPLIISSEYAHKTIITTIIETFQGILGSLVICLILLYYCLNQSAIIRIGNYLILIENALRRLEQPLNRKHVLRILLIVCLFNLILCVAVSVSELLFNINFILLISNVLPATFVGLLFIQYFSVLTLVNAIFMNLNCAIQGLYQNRLDDISLYHSRRVFVDFPTIHVLAQIRSVHNLVCDISNEISLFYSLPILIGLPFIFLTLLYDTYYLFESLMMGNGTLDSLILINTLFWTILLLYPLGLLTSKVTKVVNEVEKTGNIIHVLLNRTSNGKMKTELEQFSLQLLHRKVRFTTNGYFTLDNTFFQSMLGTMTTYMVILIQFQMGTPVSNVCSCNYTQ